MAGRNDRTPKDEMTSRSSDKMFQVMECLADNVLPMRLQDIANQLDMVQSTVLRYLNSLVQNNYAYQDETTLRYGLTLKINKMSYKVNSFLGVKSIAAPFLNDITRTQGVSSCLVIENDGETAYLDVVNKPSLTRNALNRIGKAAPMYCTGSGKIFLSAYNEYAFNEYVAKGLAPMTSYTITDPEKLKAELQKIREQGFAVDDEECEDGIRCLSVPLYDYRNEIAAALSVFAPAGVMSNARIAGLLPVLNEAAKEISLRMGSDIVPFYDLKHLELS